MKRMIILFFLFICSILLTGCDLESVFNYSNEDSTNGKCPGGWMDNGQCCIATYSGQNVDDDDQCPGAQLSGKQVRHGTQEKYCYIVECSSGVN